MLAYGDRSEPVDPRARLTDLSAELRRIAAMPSGLTRHAAIVSAFIAMGQVTQGVADALFARDGVDRRSAEQDACMALLLELAKAVVASWDSGFSMVPVPPIPNMAVPLPDDVEVHLPEGYAFYALYPESYIEAARCLPVTGPVHVIGIRSIGTGLAAIVAATLGTSRLVTLRPVGHPFERTVSIAPALADELSGDAGATYVVVDEGPGLSGSSFGAVADFLEARGVRRDRIAVLPGHCGDLGPHACDRHRRRWNEVTRRVVDTDRLLLTGRLASWAAELLGPLETPLQDISGGSWRARIWPDDADWPAVDANQERRKFLVRAGGADWLLKFAGLGAEGERKLARARALHTAGLVPEPRGLLHGFLVERWVDAVPVDLQIVDRGALVAHVGRYLAARAQLFPADAASGGSLDDLFEMLRFNSASALGEKRAAATDRWRPLLEPLARQVRRVEIDGRCDAHEWLRLADGRFLKTDALDHHAGHDCIGCQDIGWDVAGASVELGLSAKEQASLCSTVGRGTRRPVDMTLLSFLTPCYLAFRLGIHRLAAQALGGWPAEAARNAAAADQYADRLDALLGARC